MGFLRKLSKRTARALGLRRPPRPEIASGRGLLFEQDRRFNELYDRGLERSGSHKTRLVVVVDKRRERHYNLLQLLDQTAGLEGDVAECGCWKGLSSYLMLNRLREERPDFDGSGYHVVDSFAGLSRPTEDDRIGATPDAAAFGGSPGDFSAGLEHVRSVLSAFPGVSYHAGWIPAVLAELPEARYRFVHVDVDLHDPTRAALEYFYERLLPGGAIVCDDYGSLLWPGARKAVDEFCASRKTRPLSLSSGQGVVFRRG